MDVVHSSSFLQEVKKLEKRKIEAKDDDQRREVEQKLWKKKLEKELALAKLVRSTAEQLTYKYYHSCMQ